MIDDPLITATDFRRIGVLCVPGVKLWCESHGLDFRKYVREGGIRLSELEKINDGYAKMICEWKRANG